MHSLQRRLLYPRLPTVLADQTYIELPGYDLLLFYTDGVWVVPAQIDVPTLEEAASRVLQLYPHGAGQLRCVDGRWSIELTNTAIPLDIEYKLDIANSSSLLDNNWVVQDDISPLLSNVTNVNDGNFPLLRLKITFFKDETCIGGSWHHTLGDGAMMHRCFHTLSQFYQGLAAEFAAPDFQKYHLPPPSRSVMDNFLVHMPYLHTSRHLSQSEYAESRKTLEHMRWRVDNRDLEELRSALSSKGKGDVFLSKQDCLIAYLVTALNYNRSEPVRKITNTISCRSVGASGTSFAENLASNLLVDITADVPTDMAGIAFALRRALIRCREPNYIYCWLTLAGSLMLEAANAGKTFPYCSDDDGLIVNSFTALDWCSSHFGCPGSTRFYTNDVDRFTLSSFRSNPRKDDDGAWQVGQSVEVSMGVPEGLKLKLTETLSQGIHYMLDK